MKDKILENRLYCFFISSVFLFLVFFYFVFFLINRDFLLEYQSRVFPNVLLDSYDLSNESYSQVASFFQQREDEILDQKVVFSYQGKEVEATLKDIGLEIDSSLTIQEIQNFQKQLSYSKKLLMMNENSTSYQFPFYYSLKEEDFRKFFEELEKQVNVSPTNGYFDTSNGVVYHKGNVGYQIDYSKNLQLIQDTFAGNYDFQNLKISLIGEEVPSSYQESYSQIDTLVSSFVTTFDWIPLRIQNLETGVRYVNGAIVEPGEVFSFYRYAGPYNKNGYIFYYEYVGNGVCQVATTVYDAALLGGHEIVTRSPHKKKSVYVDGGLDATVASSDDGSWNTDMQFRNVYSYPIYIKAYIVGQEIHVEFWSNHDALQGKSYRLESVWLGGRGYQSYRYTYQDGVEVSKELIATTWYPED